jgi:cystathionine beta-lyase
MGFDFDKVIDRKGTYCTQWDYIADRFGAGDLLPFTISDMDFETAPSIKNALIKRVEHGVFGYSRWNNDDFKNAVKNWFSKRFDADINTDMIAYSPSIIYAVSKLIERYSKENDGVIVQKPGYDGFYTMLSGLKRKVLDNDLIYDENAIAQIDFNALESLAKQAKIILLCNPHNPTGRLWTQNELAQIFDIAKRNNLYIISDDAHQDIVFKPNKHCPISKVWGDYEKAAIITSTAKGFNTASLGGAYAIFNSAADKKWFIDDLKARGLSSAPILFIISLIAAYTSGQNWLDECVDAIENNLRFIDNFLKSELKEIEMSIPQASYFAWLNAGKLKLSSKQIQEKLINKGKIAIMSGDIYRQFDPPYLRLNAGCPLSKIKDAMTRIKMSFEN